MGYLNQRRMEASYLVFLHLVLQCLCQQLQPQERQLPMFSISANESIRKTSGLGTTERFRQILGIDENNREINRFPQQSFPDPAARHLNLSGRLKGEEVPAVVVRTSDRIIDPSVVRGHQTISVFPHHTNNHRRAPSTHSQFTPSLIEVQTKRINNQDILALQQTLPVDHPTIATKGEFFINSPQVFEAPHDTRLPEPPRAPEIPAHLPMDLTNRLREFPSLAASFEQGRTPASMHAFFEPTHEVQAEELTDEEWHQYLAEEWQSHGVVPSFLPTPPTYVANVNYGDHLCLHLGNNITPAQARHRPKTLEFPAEANRQYTVVLVDLDHRSRTGGGSSSSYINWLLINVPADQLHKGMEIMEYEPPRPGQGTGLHRMVFLVYLQQTAIPHKMASLPKARACETLHREGVDLTQLARDLGLKGPIAGNYFQTEWDVTVEHACSSS